MVLINILHSVNVHFGGVGLYSSQKDYLSILRHLLQIKAARATNPILSLASVNLIFEPSLPPAGAETISLVAAVLSKYLGLPVGAAQFSRGLLVNTADVPGKRKKHSGACTSSSNLVETSLTRKLQGGGWANTSFFVDPTTGVAAVFATQVTPVSDEKHEQMYAQLEGAIYEGLAA